MQPRYNPVVVVAADDLTVIIHDDPLRETADDPARYLVAFVSNPSILATAKPLPNTNWGPEAFAIGRKTAYPWCVNGVHTSRLFTAFMRVTGENATTRSWATVLKLHALAETD